jgi:uncharacterized SAM-binding protein YcdF (DUF218 family)
MFFILSKFVEAALLPSNIIAILAVFGLSARMLRWRRTGAGLLAFSAILLFLCGWSPLGPAATMVLEDRFPIPALPAKLDGIIMLGGAVDTNITADRDSVALTDGAERLFALAVLARRYPEARLILSGGGRELLLGKTLSESEDARRVLVDIGVAPERIEMEERSQTTSENAEESFALAGPKSGEKWLLITSAYHMPRAVASFRAAGFPVLPYPVDFRTRPADLRRPVNSIADGLELTDLAAHEWVGLLTYRFTGKTRQFLPD